MRFQKHKLAKKYAEISRKLQTPPVTVSQAFDDSSLSEGAANSSLERNDYTPKPAYIAKQEVPMEKTVIPLINGQRGTRATQFDSKKVSGSVA